MKTSYIYTITTNGYPSDFEGLTKRHGQRINNYRHYGTEWDDAQLKNMSSGGNVVAKRETAISVETMNTVSATFGNQTTITTYLLCCE